MKITSAHVWDPRNASTYADPMLHVEVDGPVFEGEPIFTGDGAGLPGYKITPCGPFYALDKMVGQRIWSDTSNNWDEIGEVNKLGIIAQQLMPIKVEDPTEVHELLITVRRARRLLRQHSLGYDWNILVDEQKALVGSLQWRVELRYPVCYGGEIVGQAHCKQESTHTIIHKNTHLTLCQDHLDEHSDRMRKNRQLSKS